MLITYRSKHGSDRPEEQVLYRLSFGPHWAVRPGRVLRRHLNYLQRPNLLRSAAPLALTDVTPAFGGPIERWTG